MDVNGTSYMVEYDGGAERRFKRFSDYDLAEGFYEMHLRERPVLYSEEQVTIKYVLRSM